MWKILEWMGQFSKPKPKPVYPDVDVAQDLLKSHNVLRKSFGVGELAMDDTLVEASRQHAEWMYSKRKMSHNGKGNSTPKQRVMAMGSKSFYVGENILVGDVSVKAAMEIWYDSRDHRSNMLDRIYKKFGAAKVGNYWCVVFGD